MNNMDEFNVEQNKAIRGFILRALVRGQNYTLLCRQISNLLLQRNLIISPDIGEHLQYLEKKQYVEFTNKKINSINAYKTDAAVQLTPKGVDLVEGNIDEDPGVDV